MMSEACGLAGMRVEDFYNATPREVTNVISGFYRLEKHRQENSWLVGRSIAAAVMASMVGGKEVKYDRMPFFPPLPGSHSSDGGSQLSEEQIADLSAKMEDALKNPDKYNTRVYGSDR